jgi:anti-anti-sigma factor
MASGPDRDRLGWIVLKPLKLSKARAGRANRTSREPLTCDVEQRDAALVIRLGGALARDSAAEIQHVFLQHLERGSHRLIVDFDRVTFIDSTGIGILLQLNAECRNAGGQLALTGASSAVANVIRQATRNLIIKFYADIAAALRHVENVPADPHEPNPGDDDNDPANE